MISFSAHTYFMTKSKYMKKVFETVVLHSTCAKCKWLKITAATARSAKGDFNRCFFNLKDSARFMKIFED